MARTMRVAVVAALVTFVALAYVPSASADAASGVAYLASTQDTSGGWDAGGSEFVTSEALHVTTGGRPRRMHLERCE